MSKLPLNQLISDLLAQKRGQLLAALHLRRSSVRKKKLSRTTFKIAAQDALKRNAKIRFKKLTRPYEKIVFRRNDSPQEKMDKFDRKLRRLRSAGIKRLIYIYWGRVAFKRSPIYVGKTVGAGGRANKHPDIFREFDVRMIHLYRVKLGKKYLHAAECLGIHAYSPKGKRYPPANRRRGDKKTRCYACRICRYTRKSWKIVQTIVK